MTIKRFDIETVSLSLDTFMFAIIVVEIERKEDICMFNTTLSIIFTVIAACMWGSWMQVVKHKKDYPIAGIIFNLYLFSLLGIFILTILIAPKYLPDTFINASLQNSDTILRIIFGGALMSMGLFFSLNVMNKVGMLLATTISGAVTNILGIVTTLLEEGIPNKPNALLWLIFISFIFILAGFVCNLASKSRDKDRGKVDEETITFKVVIMCLISAILTTGWSIGVSAGTASGLSPVVTGFYMSLGSFLSVLVVCGFIFTKNHEWKKIFCLGENKSPLLLSLISAFCHYGGNILSIYSMPALSAIISFLLGRVSTLATIFWGIYYKEFDKTSKKTKILLILGIILFFVGLGVLFYYSYYI